MVTRRKPMKIFSRFWDQAEDSFYKVWLSEEQSKKKKKDLKLRMSKAYKRNQRQKKIDKLMSDPEH
jgi:hypothetical protein